MSRSSDAGHPARTQESALVVLVPEAEPLVSAFRSRFDPSAARGMPAHITLLYPFHSADRLSASRVSELAAFFSGWRRFCFSLVGICGFEGVVVLAPEPLDPFDALTQALAA